MTAPKKPSIINNPSIQYTPRLSTTSTSTVRPYRSGLPQIPLSKIDDGTRNAIHYYKPTITQTPEFKEALQAYKSKHLNDRYESLYQSFVHAMEEVLKLKTELSTDEILEFKEKTSKELTILTNNTKFLDNHNQVILNNDIIEIIDTINNKYHELYYNIIHMFKPIIHIVYNKLNHYDATEQLIQNQLKLIEKNITDIEGNITNIPIMASTLMLQVAIPKLNEWDINVSEKLKEQLDERDKKIIDYIDKKLLPAPKLYKGFP
jgi:hypothetical protein